METKILREKLTPDVRFRFPTGRQVFIVTRVNGVFVRYKNNRNLKGKERILRIDDPKLPAEFDLL